MARPTTLTQEEKKENRKRIESNTISFRPDELFKNKFDKFCEGKNKTQMLINIIKSNKEFKEFKF